jgi:hypothetical protein
MKISDPLDDHRNPLADADAHRREPVSPVLTSESIDEGGEDFRT